MCIALAATIALLSPVPNRSVADPSDPLAPLVSEAARQTDRPDQRIADERIDGRIAFAQAVNRPILLPDPDDLNSSHMDADASRRQSSINAKPIPDNPADANPRKGDSTEGQGHGSARTHPPDARASASEPPPASGSPRPNQGGVTSSGSGESTGNLSLPGNEMPTGATVKSQSKPQTHTPPWAGEDWPKNIRRAEVGLSSGRVPASYQDMIHRYFSTDED